MSRLPDYCECSLPDSQKKCRIACGKPLHPDRVQAIQAWLESLMKKHGTSEQLEALGLDKPDE